VFDTVTCTYVRTDVLDESSRDIGVYPFMASFPHLIDVGVMGHCIHGKTGLCAKAGIGCNQLALGGRGDSDQHEHFEDLLRISRKQLL